MKEQIAPHLERLEGFAANGDERAQEKIIALQVKVKQIDAVLPYLEKCITKNKEAEQKTIAILEKKRDEELAALEKGTAGVSSSTDKSESDKKNSTSDLYMKVLAENSDMGESPQLSEAFGETRQTTNNVHHSTPLHGPHDNVINSTPVQSSGASTHIVISDSVTPISYSHDQEHLTASQSLDETIVASANAVQEQPIPLVVEPSSLETSSSSVVAQGPEQSALPSMNPELSVVEPRPRSDSKPPPIKPKKKKVPPPRPPRRSSSYLSDGFESQYSPVQDTKQRSSVVSTGSAVAPQPPRRSSSFLSDNVVESQGSPAPESRQSVERVISNVTTSSPVISQPPHRRSSYASEPQEPPNLESKQRQSIDHSIANAMETGSPSIPLRSSGSINKTSEYLGEDLTNVSVFSKIKVRMIN